MITREEALALLAKEPVFWSRLGFGYDPPRKRNGEAIIFNTNYKEYRRVHDDFSKAGVRLHTCIVQSGWYGPGEYDYTATDRAVDELMRGAPERLFIPRIKLNAPVSWCKANPEEVFVYWGGPETAEEIAALADTPAHDWFGFDSQMGYPVNGGTGFVDDRPNVNGVIGLQSMSSEKWRRDAGEALRRLILHLENGPYGGQIIGYHVAFGCCGETTNWGAWRRPGENRRGDYGIGHRRDFLAWALGKYGSEAALRAAWAVPAETALSAVRAPCPNDRESHGISLEDDFYTDSRIVPDYNEFLSERGADAIEHFGRVVHDTCGKAAGAFYGYLMVPQSAYAGHLAVERILNSPDVDFLSSPKAYSYHTVGEPGGEQALSRSYNLKKLWLDEVDNRTHLERRGTADMTHSMEETLTVLWRECMKNLTGGQNFWWMDLGEGWFDDPQIMEHIGKMFRVQAEANKTPHRTVSEVLLLCDEMDIMNRRVSYGLTEGLLKRMDREAKLTGAPVDMFRLKDIDRLPMEQYKVVIFLNCGCIGKKEQEAIWHSIRPDATVIWHFAPGVLSSGFEPEHVRTLTGFTPVTAKAHSQFMYDNIPGDFAPLRVTGGKDLLADEEGAVLSERTFMGRKCLYVTEPLLTHEMLRSVYGEAGVHLYAPDDCTVYADSRLISVFSHDQDVDGVLRLPESMTLEDLLTGERFGNVRELPLRLPARRMRVFRRVP